VADLRSPQSALIRGMLIKERESLFSLFRPGMAVSVAESKAATALLGPLDILRRSRCSLSLEKARCKDLPSLANRGRLATAPGFGCLVVTVLGFAGFIVFGGEARKTGPPNFLLRESQRSGNRAEKLYQVS